MTTEIVAALIGAGIALVGGVVGALAQHLLSLRADKVKRQRDRQDEEARWIRDREHEEEQRQKERHKLKTREARERLLKGVELETLVECPGCGAAVPPGTHYCPSCGMAVTAEARHATRFITPGSTVCGNCGSSVHKSAAFCERCGSSLRTD